MYGTAVILDSSNTLKHSLELAFLLELDNSSHGAIVAASNELAADPNSRNGSTPHQIGEFRPNGLSVGVHIQFNDLVISRRKYLLRLDAVGSGGERQEKNRIVANEVIQSIADGLCIVVSSYFLYQGFLSFVEEIKKVGLRS